MDLDGASFFDAAMTVVARYGMKRTTMADLARAASVSRQTIYDRFGDKDRVMATMIDYLSERTANEIRDAFAQCSTLGPKLDAYFEIAVWPIYELMQTMPDAADFEKGMGSASTAASQKAADIKRALLSDMLRAELLTQTQPPEDVAAFVERASSRAKMSNITRDELESFLRVLKTSVIALARQS